MFYFIFWFYFFAFYSSFIYLYLIYFTLDLWASRVYFWLYCLYFVYGFNAKSTFEWAYVKLTLFLIVIRVCWRPSWFFLSHDFYILFKVSNWNCISWSFASRESILSSSFFIAEDSWLRVDYSRIFCWIVYSRVVIILNRRIK